MPTMFSVRSLHRLSLIAIAAVLSLAPGVRAEEIDLGEVFLLGDSITRASGYRDQLYTNLTNGGYTFQFVGSQTDRPTDALLAAGQEHHEGHGGYRIIDLHHNLLGLDDNTTGYPTSTNSGGFWLSGTTYTNDEGVTITRPALHPDVILLLAGTNDITTGVTMSAAVDPEQDVVDRNLLSRMRKLLNVLVTERPDATIYLGNLTKRTGMFADTEDEVEAFNAALPALLAEPQYAEATIHLVDLWTAVGDEVGDGVHPSDLGYQRMGDAWYAAIQSNTVPEPGTLGLMGAGGLIWACRRRVQAD